MRTSLRT